MDVAIFEPDAFSVPWNVKVDHLVGSNPEPWWHRDLFVVFDFGVDGPVIFHLVEVVTFACVITTRVEARLWVDALVVSPLDSAEAPAEPQQEQDQCPKGKTDFVFCSHVGDIKALKSLSVYYRLKYALCCGILRAALKGAITISILTT